MHMKSYVLYMKLPWVSQQSSRFVGIMIVTLLKHMIHSSGSLIYLQFSVPATIYLSLQRGIAKAYTIWRSKKGNFLLYQQNRSKMSTTTKHTQHSWSFPNFQPFSLLSNFPLHWAPPITIWFVLPVISLKCGLILRMIITSLSEILLFVPSA